MVDGTVNLASGRPELEPVGAPQVDPVGTSRARSLLDPDWWTFCLPTIPTCLLEVGLAARFVQAAKAYSLHRPHLGSAGLTNPINTDGARVTAACSPRVIDSALLAVTVRGANDSRPAKAASHAARPPMWPDHCWPSQFFGAHMDANRMTKAVPDGASEGRLT